MVEQQVQVSGETIIDDSVVAALAAMAARSVEGVVELGRSTIQRMIADRLGGRGTSGVMVAMGQNEVVVDLTLSVRYGYNIPQTVRQVRERVAGSLMDNAGLSAKEINVHISGIEFGQQEKPLAIKGHEH